MVIYPAIGVGYSLGGLYGDFQWLTLILLLTLIGYAAFRLLCFRNDEQDRAKLFHKIFNTKAIGFVIGDFDGRIYEANDYYLELIQRSREDIDTGLNWKMFTPPEHMSLSQEHMQEILRTGSTTPFEKEYVRTDGSRIWVLVGATRCGNDRLVSYVLDISDRKRDRQDLEEIKSRLEDNVAQRTKELLDANRELYRLVSDSDRVAERLRESQSFLDSVIENIPNMIFVKDAQDLRYVRINRAGEELLGVTRVELLGKSDHDTFPKEQADFFVAKDRAVLRDRTVLDISEEPISTPAGERFLHTKKIPICDKYGDPIYLLGISEDITEKKQADRQRAELLLAQVARNAAERTAEKLKFMSEATAALNESLDIRSLLNAFAEVIVRNMADWCFIDFYYENERSIERMVIKSLGDEPPEELRTWWETQEFDLQAQEGIGAVIRTGEARIYQNLDRAHSSQYAWNPEVLKKINGWGIHSVMITPLVYHGKTLGALTFILTGEKSYEEFDLSVAQDLARRASLAIENARLYNQAFEASRAKSAFLANISHEIRTPLGAMLGFAELILEDKTLSGSQSEYVMTIARNGRQLLRIVDEVLDLSKVESDRILIDRVSFQLLNLLEEVKELLTIKAVEKGIRLVVTGTRSLPENVVTDPLRLRQILINVIGNAIKFTEKGSVTVDTKFIASPETPQRGTLEIAVIDTGVGMNTEQADNLFQPFVQADSSMTRKFGGTGLGLFLARKLARLLHGDVVLRRSTLGTGSEFVITIELELAQAKPTKEKSQAISGGNGSEHDHARVLVVDDSPDNRMLISAMLKNSGVSLEMAENGVTGVQKALERDFDLVLMDIQMPEMDGYEAIRTLSDEGYKTPVVALTAHAMKGDRERCIEAGFSDYICKPVTRQALLNCIDRFVGQPDSPTLH